MCVCECVKGGFPKTEEMNTLKAKKNQRER